MEEKKASVITHYLHLYLPVILWCTLIFFLSSQPHLPGPEDKTWDFLFKKLGHICAYGILYVLSFRAFCHPERSRRIVYIQSFLFCILYAASDEYHQSFVPGRTPMVRDVAIDIIGMSLAASLSKRYDWFHKSATKAKS